MLGEGLKPSPHHRWLVIYISPYLLIGNYLWLSRSDLRHLTSTWHIAFPSETLYWNGVDRRLTLRSCTKPDLAASYSSVILHDQFFTGLMQ
jgi:hypothetical protein